MVRTKAVAVLLGPSGVGLVGLCVSATGVVSTIAQLGIDQSGVRQVAEANGSGDPERVARVVKTLRRVCWLTGILGWILTVALAWPLSQWTFVSAERLWAVAIATHNCGNVIVHGVNGFLLDHNTPEEIVGLLSTIAADLSLLEKCDTTLLLEAFPRSLDALASSILNPCL